MRIGKLYWLGGKNAVDKNLTLQVRSTWNSTAVGAL